jgi:hypothetical protein
MSAFPSIRFPLATLLPVANEEGGTAHGPLALCSTSTHVAPLYLMPFCSSYCSTRAKLASLSSSSNSTAPTYLSLRRPDSSAVLVRRFAASCGAFTAPYGASTVFCGVVRCLTVLCPFAGPCVVRSSHVVGAARNVRCAPLWRRGDLC